MTERWHQSLKGEYLRPGVPFSVEDARRLASRYVRHCNTVRLHSAIGYVTPLDKLEGRQRFVASLILPGETEAGSAGTQPCRGIARWAHQDDEVGVRRTSSTPPHNYIGLVDPYALKIPARRAEESLTNGARPEIPKLARPVRWKAGLH
ncbi:MAG: integrase core domain-containing protein, partial [Armatimonadota bacterium]|nr:integrase core domain-containing protein [Armatimonadota bacterium]